MKPGIEPASTALVALHEATNDAMLFQDGDLPSSFSEQDGRHRIRKFGADHHRPSTSHRKGVQVTTAATSS